MNFTHTEEQEAVRELAGQILADAVSPELLFELERKSEMFDEKLWAQLAESNLLGVAIPEDCGGSDFGLTALMLLLEEAGRHLAPVPLFSTLVLGALPIAAFGTPGQRERLLGPVARGEAVLSAALTEPAHISPDHCATTARIDGDAFRLDGVKVCVPSAARSLRILVPARLDDGRTGIFMVDPRASGVNCEAVDVTSHEPHHRVTLTDVLVPADDVLGAVGDGDELAAWIEQRARAGLAAMQLGIAAEATARTAAYTAERQQFGRAIGSFQAVSVRAADAFIDTDALRSVLWQAVWRLEEGVDAEKETLAAKWWACDAGHRVVHSAQHLHGGMGADIEYPIHRYFLWAKQIEQTLGGAPLQLRKLGARIAQEATA